MGAAVNDLRKAIAQAIYDPGATEGYKGNRSLTDWQTDAVMRCISVPCPSCGGTGHDIYGGTLNYDGGMADCTICNGRTRISAAELYELETK